MSPASKAQQKAVNKYMKENYDRVNLILPRGKKTLLQEHVQKTEESVNAFINRAIDETIARDGIYADELQKVKDAFIYRAVNEAIERDKQK